MQTFIPVGNYLYAAQYLDNKRLNKQILEAYQILKVLSTDGKGWRNHPAVLMWEGHEHALHSYARTMVSEARIRGIKVDKNLSNITELKIKYSHLWGKDLPKWFDEESMSRVVATHRASLYRKDPIYYVEYAKEVNSKHNKPCCEGCNYYWPTHPRIKK
jgi:hypothetical protein